MSCSSACDALPKAKASRERFKGCPLEASAIVGPFVTSPTSIEYDDSFTEARVQPKLILSMQCMWEKVKSDYSDQADVANIVFEQVIYLSAGRKQLPFCQNMSSDWARGYHEWVVGHRPHEVIAA